MSNLYQKAISAPFTTIKTHLGLRCELVSSNFGEPQLIVPGFPKFSTTLNFDGGFEMKVPSPLISQGELATMQILLTDTEKLIDFLK